MRMAGALMLLGLAACSRGDPEPDPVVLDQTFNNIIAEQEAQRARLVEEARIREAQRMREMEENATAYEAAAANLTETNAAQAD